MDADGQNVRRLTTSQATDTDPAISPDGRRIAYSSQNRDGTTGDIVVANLDGSNPTRLTSATRLNMQPVWSPDGQRIAFVSNRDGNNNIYGMNADGTNQTQLTNHPGDDVTPTWGYLAVQSP
jgi:TolB protein